MKQDNLKQFAGGRRIRRLLIVFAMVFVMLADALPVMAVTGSSRSVPTFSLPSTMTMYVGDQKTASVSVNPSNTDILTNISYQTDNKVSLDASDHGSYWGGKTGGSFTLTAKSTGTSLFYATVNYFDPDTKAKLGSVTLRCEITVLPAASSTKPSTSTTTTTTPSTSTSSTSTSTTTTTTPSTSTSTTSKPAAVPLQSISLNKTSDTLTVGDTMYLSVTYRPTNTTDPKSVTWSSSNPSVASVSGRKVTARKAGTATITAKVGSKTATCKVTVKAKETNGIKKNPGTQLFNALNKYRVSKGRKKLKRDAKLQATAEVRAKELRRKFSHTRPNGKSCYTAYPKGLKVMGENICMGSTSASAANKALINSTPHRKNMLDKDYTKVGCACYYYNGTYYWVQCFGK